MNPVDYQAGSNANHTHVPTTNSNGLIKLLAVLQIITLLAFGGYIYYREFMPQTNEDKANNNIESSVSSPAPSSATQPNVTEKQEEGLKEKVTIRLNDKLSEVERGLEMDIPLGTILIQNSGSGGKLEGEDFEMYINTDYEDEGWSGSAYKDNYTRVDTQNFGTVYRVQSIYEFNIEDYGYEGIMNPEYSQTFEYVDGKMFKTTGECEGYYSASVGNAPAPCGNGALHVVSLRDENVSEILTIYCRANDMENMKVCDAIVASMKLVE